MSKEAYNSFKRKRIIYGHEVILPEPPPISQIANHELPKHKQKFYPTPLPKDFDDWDKDKQVDFVRNEWSKIKNGYWFFNGGNLEYITGIHYFYINWWKIKISQEGKPKRMGLPSFIDADRDFFYIWDKAEKSDKIAGVAFITNRRDGKSYKAGVIAYLGAIMNPDAHVGMQSKTEGDAKGLMKKIINAWKQLPYIFRPPDTGDTNPSKSLRFEPTTKKDAKTAIKERRSGGNYLNSFIDFKSSDSYSYDGLDLLRYILDEFGKPQKSDTNETLRVVRETMVDGTTITGKILAITTVEDIESTGEDEGVKGIWNAADINKLNAFGMTKNGLIQYFKPAYTGMRGKDENGVPFINEFGYSDWRRAKAYREKIRESLQGQALVSEIRKYPFNIEEAFNTTHGCAFNEKHLNDQLKYNRNYVNEDNLHRGNFVWRTNEVDGIVDWKPDPEGRFLVSWFPDKKDRNKWHWANTEKGRHREPTRSDVVGGVDPYDHDDTADSRKSNAGFHLFRKPNVWDDGEKNNPHTNTFVLEYIYRQPTAEEFYEDVLLASVFYSAFILFENNKPNLDGHFNRHGYFGFLMKRPDELHTEYSKKRTVSRGIATSGKVTKGKMVNRLERYVHRDMGLDDQGNPKVWMPFNKTLEDWKKFNPTKWTDFDATVSSMLALVASDVEIKLHTREEVSEPIIPRFDNSGMESVLLN